MGGNVDLQPQKVEITRRPVKDKGALMQTLHLRFRDLRAISPGQSPSRWQTPSMQGASKRETASPLPNPLRPTCAVGSRPAVSRQHLARCPTVGAGLVLAYPQRQARASEDHRSASPGLSFPLRPQRYGARASGKKTADRTANVGALAGVSSAVRRQRLRPCSVAR